MPHILYHARDCDGCVAVVGQDNETECIAPQRLLMFVDYLQGGQQGRRTDPPPEIQLLMFLPGGRVCCHGLWFLREDETGQQESANPCAGQQTGEKEEA